MGRPEEALPYLEKALRLTPLDAGAVFYYYWLGHCQILLGNTDEAINLLMRSRSANRHSPGTHLYLAAALALKGDTEGARKSLADYHRLKPELTTMPQLYAANPHWTATPEYAALRRKTVDHGLRLAGVLDE